jgi:DNA-binding NtrC family response regulator
MLGLPLGDLKFGADELPFPPVLVDEPEDEVPPAALPPATADPMTAATSVTDGAGQVLRLDELEKQAIKAALRQTGGNRTQAAAELGISIRTLRNKLQEYRGAGDPIDADLASLDS